MSNLDSRIKKLEQRAAPDERRIWVTSYKDGVVAWGSPALIGKTADEVAEIIGADAIQLTVEYKNNAPKTDEPGTRQP